MVFNGSTPKTPLVFVLSPGVDPTAQVRFCRHDGSRKSVFSRRENTLQSKDYRRQQILVVYWLSFLGQHAALVDKRWYSVRELFSRPDAVAFVTAASGYLRRGSQKTNSRAYVEGMMHNISTRTMCL